jgi:hypothetical protein
MFNRRHASRSLITWISSLTFQPLVPWRRYRATTLFWRLIVAYYNTVVILFSLSLILSIFDVVFRSSYIYQPKHYNDLRLTVESSTTPGRANPGGKKIFIASNIIQHELIRGQWGENLIKLVDYLGPQNVFVSIYENDSGPEAPKALAWLRDQLQCEYSITFGDHIPLSDFPTVITPEGDVAVKRLTYLTEVRNRMLKPLNTPPTQSQNNINYTTTSYDNILFLNDIYYNPIDALNLLFNTNNGNYDIACAADFWHGATIYDTFVLHDTDGFEVDWFTYPWFTTQGSSISRKAALAQSDAVPVKACFNGMAAYKAGPFLHSERNVNPLRFRAQSDLFWEASECCLLAADVQHRNREAKIFLNPFVRVIYTIIYIL